MHIVTCLTCNGTGMIGQYGCGSCHGSCAVVECDHSDDSWTGTHLPHLWICDGCGSLFVAKIAQS